MDRTGSCSPWRLGVGSMGTRSGALGHWGHLLFVSGINVCNVWYCSFVSHMRSMDWYFKLVSKPGTSFLLSLYAHIV